MTLYNKRKKKLIEELKDKKYRDAFVEESINVGIPFQIKALREQRGLTQKDFEKKYNIKQTEISRWENPNYSKFTLSTLKKIASVFDVGLMVRFVPISNLVEWELNLTTESLKALSFDDDPYFKEQTEETVPISSTERHIILPTVKASCTSLDTEDSQYNTQNILSLAA